MSSEESKEVADSSKSPYNETGLTALFIGLSTAFITDSNWRSGVDLAAPFVSYGIIYLVKSFRRDNKIEKACRAIDNSIARLKAANLDQNTPQAEREENEKEIIRLNQLRTDTELKHYEIK